MFNILRVCTCATVTCFADHKRMQSVNHYDYTLTGYVQRGAADHDHQRRRRR